MGKRIAYAAGGLALLAAAGAAGYEWQGRRLRRQDESRRPPCVDGSQIRLRDQRLLGFQLSGRQTDPPVFYFHGTLGSRLEWPLTPGAAEQAGVWLIAVDRPAYGCSDPAPERSILDFADDVRQLADRFGIRRFRIIAWSVGTIYAMGCAYRMPERVTRLDLVGTMAPRAWERRGGDHKEVDFLARLAQWAPGTAYALMRVPLVRRERDPDWFEDQLAEGLSPADRAVSFDPAVRACLKRSHATGESRLGTGVMHDLELAGNDWGFSPSQVRTPVVMWQGAEDHLTPESRNAPLLRVFPNAEQKRFPGEGHFLLYRHERELLEE